jgi:hypothetical protein
LFPGDALDMDIAQTNTGSGDDLTYQVDQNYHLLIPQASAVLGVFGSSQPVLASCQSAGMSTAPIAVESLSPGAYLCYRTAQGLPGWMRLNSFDTNNFSINIDFQTWGVP